MRRTLQTLAAALLLSAPAMAATHAITANSNFTYSPGGLTAQVGDTLIFGGNFSFHPTVQVSQSTWNANGATALPGGFSATSGSTMTVVITTLDDIYYVCRNHVASAGMKGMVTVQAAVAVKPTLALGSLYPNPVQNEISLPASLTGSVFITSMTGQTFGTYTLAAGQQRLSVAYLPPGTYVLRAASRAYRFVKE